MAIASSVVQEKPHVTVVGGGIAGLYAAYLLALEDYTVDLYELNPDFLGGKIATRWYPLEEAHGMREFLAEFGPMRFGTWPSSASAQPLRTPRSDFHVVRPDDRTAGP